MKTIIKKSYQSLSVLLLSTAALSSLAVESGKLKLSEVTTLAKDLRGDGTIGDGVFNIASTLLFWGGIAIIIIGIVSAYSGINKAIKNKREGEARRLDYRRGGLVRSYTGCYCGNCWANINYHIWLKLTIKNAAY